MLREQIRTLAEELGYQPPIRPNPKAFAADVFVRGERTVQVGYTSTGDKIVNLRVNGEWIRPSGKWPTIDALKASEGAN